MTETEKARERASDLIDELDAFITADGEWDTEWQAIDVITAALLDFAKERVQEKLKEVGEKADPSTDPLLMRCRLKIV